MTIFTPTYNRRDKLVKLYKSLKRQTDKSFIWLIIDDGSSDNTQELIQNWKSKKLLKIFYLYQKNQGKHIAMKTAVAACQTPWFICVDSDDLLPPSAIEDLCKDMETPLTYGGIGYIYPRQMPGSAGQRSFPQSAALINIMDAKNLYGIRETAILVQTEYLKKLEFPRFDGENFLSEEVLYIQLAQYGRFVPKNRKVYAAEYCADGITKNLFQQWIKNPQGTVRLLTLRYEFSGRYRTKVRLRERIKCIMNLNAFCMACGIPLFRVTPSKWYTAILYCPSMIWKHIRFSRKGCR